MPFHQKYLLLISPERWGKHFVSKHHYAVTLAKQGCHVYFLNPPSSEYKISSTQYPNLFILDYPPFFKGLRFLPVFLQRFLIRKKFNRLQKLANCKFDIIWSFDNSVFYDFSALPNSVLKISHIVDLNQDFQTVKAASTADICFCTTDLIKTKLKKYNPKTFKIHHGYTPPTSKSRTDFIMPGQNTLKALYVGNLSFAYIDWDILYQIAKDHKNIDFVYVGPDGKSNLSRGGYDEPSKQAIKELSNVYFVGSVSHDQIPGILGLADILLVSYKEKYHRDQASPHKIMEYLGSGKVIVATYTNEYKDKRDLLVMSDKNDDYPSLFKKVTNNIKEYNADKNQNKRREFALLNTYPAQIERINRLIDTHAVK